jgi:ubiquinone/menaquinone biosynthesis C-methylase UbiE/spore coat polysaccharide biosynthesis protein SpsF (cytidylyltransferase family)
MNKLCFIQSHYTDEYFFKNESRNSILELKDSKLFDHIIIGVGDIPENHMIFDHYSLQYGIDVFYGATDDLVDRMMYACEKYNCNLLARILINWNYVDIKLIEKMIIFVKDRRDYDYCMLPYDFDIKYGCDLHSFTGLIKLRNIIMHDRTLKEQYKFRPWNLLESDNRFNTIIFQDVPNYSNTKFYNLRNKLIGNVPVAWDYGKNFYYHEYESAKKYISKNDIVLDISSGQGNGTAVLSSFCKKIYAFDIVKEYLDKGSAVYAEEHENIEFLLGEANMPIPIADNSITFAVSIHTMEHVENDMIFLKEIKRVMKVGGILYLEVPIRIPKPFSGNTEPLLPHTDSFAGHYREYSIKSFKYLISQLFKVMVVKGVSRGSYVAEERTRNAIMAILEKR